MATSAPDAPPGRLRGKARSLCWTLNNYTAQEVESLREYAKFCKYMVFGYEVAPTTGTPHLQGYVCWETSRSIQKFKDDISDRLSVQKTLGTPAQASDYCKYDDYPANKIPNKFEEFGEIPRQGERTDWRVALTEINSGATIGEVVEHQPQLLPCVKALDFYMKNRHNRLLNPITRDVEVIVLWGDAGTHKSSWAYDRYPDLYAKPANQWWDGYTGQTTVLLDDFYGWIPLHDLLRVLDRFPYHAEVKGSHVWAQWTRVIITSNKPPDKWYSILNDRLHKALMRRLNKIYFFSIDAPPSLYPSPPPPTPPPSPQETWNAPRSHAECEQTGSCDCY